MLVLVAIAAVGPYAWDTHGWTGRALSDLLTLAAAALLGVWTATEAARRRVQEVPVSARSG
jgi:hypothetical protein